MNLTMQITDAGRAALANAENTGTLPLTLSEIALGSASYTPTADQAALQNEVKRVTTFGGDAVADDTLHVTIRDESADAYTLGEFGLITDGGVLFAVYSQPDQSILEKNSSGIVLLSADIIFTTVDVTSLSVGPTGFLLPPGTTSTQGVVQLATTTETVTGSDTAKVVTPAADKAALDAHRNESPAHSWVQISGKPATATRWPAWSEVTSKPSTFTPSAHNHTWAEITGAPSTATRWPAWSEVTSKPSTFTPSAHSHPWSEVTGKPDVWHAGNFTPGSKLDVGAKAADSDKVDGIDSSRIIFGGNTSGTNNITDLNTINKSGFYDGSSSAIGVPTSNWQWIIHHEHTSPNGHGFQLSVENEMSPRINLRTQKGGTFNSWGRLYSEFDRPTPGEIGALSDTANSTDVFFEGTAFGSGFSAGRFNNQNINIIGSAAGNFINGVSDPGNAKKIIINSTTDATNTTPTAGGNGIDLQVRGGDILKVRDSNLHAYQDLRMENNKWLWLINGSSEMRINNAGTTLDLYHQSAGRFADVRVNELIAHGTEISNSGHIVSGRGSGGVAMTVDDGHGNANLTFNHVNGIPEQNGHSGRIEVNTDGISNAFMNFRLAENVSSGISANLTTVLGLNLSGATILGNTVWHEGNVPSTATRWPAWNEVTSKPSTFQPSAHGHDWSDINNVPTTSSRTSSSTSTLLQAAAMNNHVNSADHDGRYLAKGLAYSAVGQTVFARRMTNGQVNGGQTISGSSLRLTNGGGVDTTGAQTLSGTYMALSATFGLDQSNSDGRTGLFVRIA